MQRSHWKENQFGGVSNNRGSNSSRGVDKFDKFKDDKNRYTDKKLNDPKKVEPKKNQVPQSPQVPQGPSRDDTSPKRAREEDKPQIQKKVKTTEVRSNPISELGKNILNVLKNVYNSVFGSKKD